MAHTVKIVRYDPFQYRWTLVSIRYAIADTEHEQTYA